MKNLILFLLALVMLSSCGKVMKRSIKSGMKDAAKEVTEEATEAAVKKGAKKVFKEGAELTLENLPKGRKSLAVVSDGKRLVPAINNLNELGSKYSSKINKQLLKIRRAAISPYDQFPTMSQLANYDVKKLFLSDLPNADLLRKNLYLCMDKKSVDICKAFGGTMAHHVIEGSDKAAVKSRAILKKFHININAPENGVLLPDGKNSIYKGSQHMTHHTPEYSEYVYSKIKDCKSREELVSTLQTIKHELVTGKLNLQGPAQQINKNIKEAV